MSSTELVPAPQGARELRRVTDDDFMPLLAVQKVIARKNALAQVIKEVLIEGTDYGIQPGSVNDQKVLKKSGAEKLISTFGLAPRIVSEEKIEDWTGEQHGGEPFFYYKYVIALYRGDLYMGEAGGSCNSWETKYRWRWISEAEAKDRPDYAKLPKRGGRRKLFEPDFALEKMQTTGQYGKPQEYWDRFKAAVEAKTANRIQKQLGKRQFWGWEIEVDDTLVRIPNPNASDIVNTVQKMAYKRALVAPVLVVTNCSDAFTQDLDEEEDEHQNYTAAGQQPPPDEKGSPQAERGAQTAPTGKAEPASAPPPAQQTLPVERQVPEELQILVAAVRRDPKKELMPAYNLMLEAFKRRAGEPGMRAYDAINEKYRARFPRGKPQSAEDHINNLLDLWDELQKFPESPAEVASDAAVS